MPGYERWGDDERKQLEDVLRSGILMRYGFEGKRGSQWKAKELENEIIHYTGARYAHLTSSGTSALTSALSAMGIGFGDEVILPVFTFVAGFEAICSVGAIPVFVDIDETLTLSPAAVASAITPRTRAIMPVHMCGAMAQMDALLAIAKKNNIPVIEDACQAIGGSFQGKKLGTLGAAGVWSFDFVKTVTAGEGGAVLTNDKEIYTRCDAYSDHGHDHAGNDRGADNHAWPGSNYRISELHAAAGLAQFRRLDEFLEIQKKNYTLLEDGMKSIPGISFRSIPDPVGNCHSFLSWFLPGENNTKDLLKKMSDRGLNTGHFYWYDNNWHYLRNWHHLKKANFLSALHHDSRLAVMHHANKDFSASDAIMRRCVSTAISLNWTEEDIQTIISVIRS